MSQQPKVSIITPAYNAGRFISETIRSVQAQGYSNWEMCIVDDGSKDNTADIVSAAQKSDSRIRLIKNEGEHGPAQARNVALSAADGDYIAFLDSDDLWLPTKLETQIDFMIENDAALSFTEYRRMSEDGAKLGRQIQVPDKVTYHQLLKHNVIACLTVLINRKKTGDFRMTTEGYDDFILWLEIMKRGFEAHGLKQDLARYRRVQGSVSHKWGRAAGWVWNIYRDVEGLSLPYSGWCFANYSVRVYSKHLMF